MNSFEIWFNIEDRLVEEAAVLRQDNGKSRCAKCEEHAAHLHMCIDHACEIRYISGHGTSGFTENMSIRNLFHVCPVQAITRKRSATHNIVTPAPYT